MIAKRSSSRVAQRWRSRTFFWRSEKNDSMAALSAHAATRPIEPSSSASATARTKASDRNWADSIGRRNTSSMEVLMGTMKERQREVQLYRGQITSPGRPTVAWREDRVRFWAAIAEEMGEWRVFERMRHIAAVAP